MNFTMIYFFYEIMEIEKTEKLVPNFRDKEGYVIYTENLSKYQGFKSRISIEKVHRVIKIDRKAWLKSYIDTKKNS